MKNQPQAKNISFNIYKTEICLTTGVCLFHFHRQNYRRGEQNIKSYDPPQNPHRTSNRQTVFNSQPFFDSPNAYQNYTHRSRDLASQVVFTTSVHCYFSFYVLLFPYIPSFSIKSLRGFSHLLRLFSLLLLITRRNYYYY